MSGFQAQRMKGFSELAEAIVKIALSLAVFGYMALRAHFNRLGIPATESLGAERYLAETFLLATSLLLPVGLIVFALSAVLVVMSWLERLRIMRGRARQMLDAQLEKHGGLLLLLVLVAAYLALIQRLSQMWAHQDIAVGTLLQERLDAPDGLPAYLWLLAVCIGSGFAVRRAAQQEHVSPVASARQRLTTQSSYVMLFVLTLHLPLVYGWAVRPATYPKVRLALKDPAESICGLLVVETANELRVWRAERREGAVIRVPRARVFRMESGEVVDLIQSASEAVTGRVAAAPECH